MGGIRYAVQPLMSTLYPQSPQELMLCRKEGLLPTTLREHTQQAGRGDSHGVPPQPLSILRERLAVLGRAALVSGGSGGTLGLDLLSPNSILMS